MRRPLAERAPVADAAQTLSMMLPDFSKLFDDGRVIESADFGRVALKRHAAGVLAVPSGRVVACDPAAAGEAEPFTAGLAPGSYPVVLSVAHFDDGDQRVAGAMLVAGEGKPVRWEMALLPGEDVSELAEGEVFGYAADSGAGCLLDAGAAEKYAAALDTDDELFGRVADALEDTYVDTWSWANVALDEEAGLNLVAFSAGLGEGLYASYFGFDEGGRVVALVTDFALFEYEDLA